MSRSDTYESSADSNFYHRFLQPLIGKTVTVYIGMPESKTGKLLNVQSDYIVLLPENQQDTPVIYYCLQHVQSISENAKTNSIQKSSVAKNEAKIKFVQSDSFQGLLQGLINSNIKVNQGGPEAKQGKLLDVIDNYIALFTEDDGVMFYNINHIKSVSSRSSNEALEVSVDEQVSYVNTEDFQDLFSYLTNKWVSINCGGSEAVEGVLVQGIDGHYMLVNNAEVIRVNPYYIKSISCGLKGSLKATKQEEQINVKNTENTELQSNNIANKTHKDKSESRMDEGEAEEKEQKKEEKKEKKEKEKKKEKK
jgi:spore coat protein B